MPRIHWPSRKALYALAGGLLVALSLPPWGLWPLAFVGIIVFETAIGDNTSRSQRFRYGWLFAAGWLFPGMAWMWFLTEPGYIIAVVFYAAMHGIAAMVAPIGAWRVIGRPAAHTLAEAVRFSFPFGGVPLASLAISQASGPLVGVVRIGGALLLTWLTFQIGFALAGPSPGVPRFARRRRPTATGHAHGVLALAVVALVVAIAAFAPTGHATGQTLKVAVVQGGGKQGTRARDTDPRDVVERHLEATRTIGADEGIDVVLWPENVIDVDTFSTSPEFGEVAVEAKRLDATFLVGVTENAPGNRFTNAQVVVTPDGQYTDRYDKVRRVPFGEYMPLRGLLHALGAPTSLVPRDAVAGTDPAYLTLPDGTRVAVVISWEVFFGGRTRDGVEHGGEWIVNPTNGSSYTWTILQSQQIASSKLRAIETGRWLAQGAPTGFSAFVTPEGDVLDRTSIGEQEVIIHDVELRTGHTWYVTLGDAPWIVLVAIVFVVALLCSGWRPRGLRRSSRSGKLDEDGDGPVVGERDLHLSAKAAGGDGGTEAS
jgi:apolipoprotein N-acyltransferase